ncbi:hypothetical protein [Streptomyces sp. NPDC050534]|uniref:hypothetical protein n=1 Tax=Streptomyces sp. NPDC050534 TaxID=3365625 RepID=UPI00379A2F7B
MHTVRAYGTFGTGHPLRARGGRVVLALLVLAAVLLTAVPAARADEPASQAAYLAARLRADPVYVTDQLPREIPHSTAPDFARLARRTGVPTYVLVLAGPAGSGKGLLGAVHDRLGRDGLYVLVDASGVTAATAYGVRAPADDAWTVASYELPYDAGPLRSFERFVDVVAQGGAEAARRAASARERYGDHDPADLYIGPSDRDNQSFLTGVLLTAVPLSILLLVPYVRRWRGRRPGATEPTKARPRSRHPWRVPVAALTAAAAIAVTASLVFDQTRSSAAPPPTAADLTARVDRVVEGLKAEGLRHDTVYVDPESPRVLSSGRLSELHDRIRAFARSDGGGGPVYVLLVPQISEDESAGRQDVFTAAVHKRLGRDGLYVVADPLGGFIDVYDYGLRLDGDRLSFDLPESISFGDRKAEQADDHALGDRLDALMTYLDKVPRTDEPATADAYAPAPEPVANHALPPLFSGDLGPGLFVGAVTALLALALTGGGLAVVGAVLRRRHPVPQPTSGLPFTAPTDPSPQYLRRTARTELGALADEFTDATRNAAQGDAPTDTPDAPRPGILSPARAWDCFDAAMLLVDGDLDTLGAPGPGDAALVAVVVLSRAGRAALRGEAGDLCCGVNPLHGPAVGRHHVRVSAEGTRRRRLPVCEMCRNTAVADPAAVHSLLMTLPPPAGDGGRVPYLDADGPLTAVPRGIPRLIDKVRETAGVQ